jgi:plastocyanin
MYENFRDRAKLRLTPPGRKSMDRLVSASVGLMLLLAGASSAEAQNRHVIAIEADPEKDVYHFVPARVTARPGDVLVFKATRGSPHSIVFEGGDLSEATHEAMNGAMGRRTGDLSSPLLQADGSEYRIVIPRVSPGVYHFYCLPHKAYDERGELKVAK